MKIREKLSSAKLWLREYLYALTGLIYPSNCRLCGEGLSPQMTLVCPSCWEELLGYRPIVHRKNFTINGVPIYGSFSLAPHQEKARELVHLIKYEDFFVLVGRWIEGAVGSLTPLKDFSAEVIVPVPLHHTRRRERGYDQALIITRHLSDVLGMELKPRALKRTRATRPMVEVAGHERLSNVEGAFACRKGTDLAGAGVLLVDDVYTSGATISQAAKALYSAGAGRVFSFTLTRAGEQVD